jgi:peptidoglycan-associated lipoprotein
MTPSKRFACMVTSMMLLLVGACKPHYPHCKSDAQCASHNETCINGQCQECKDDSACLAKYPGEIRACVEGRCEAAPECHVTSDCMTKGADLICRNNRCVPQCTQDAECGVGQSCVSHKCVTACTADAGCPQGYLCVDGHCESEAEAAQAGLHSCRPVKAGDVVALDTVYFDFNQYDLTPQTRQLLAQAAHCLKQAPGSLKVVLEGHCDERGTQEYNLALGQRRSQAVEKYLRTLGVESVGLEASSKGKNEPVCSDGTEACYARNRRVQFVQRPGSSLR